MLWELEPWSFTHLPQGDAGLPGQPGTPGKEGKRVSKPKQVASCVGWIHVANVFCVTDPSARHAFGSDPAAAGRRKSSVWAWSHGNDSEYSTVRSIIDWQHVWPTPAGSNLKGDLRFNLDMLERIEKTILFHYWSYPWFCQCHRSRVKLLLCSRPEKLYGKFDCLQQIAVACSAYLNYLSRRAISLEAC